MMPNAKTKEEIGETVILEQYLSMVSPELRRWIVERSPLSVKEEMEMAEAFAVVRMVDGEFKLGNNKPRYRYEPEQLSKQNEWNIAWSSCLFCVRVQREQLAAIFKLLKDNQDTFGEVTEGDVEEQLKLYTY
ncbi:hypothetical protein MHYP_G00147790 [Metynnis hypsauchen]